MRVSILNPVKPIPRYAEKLRRILESVVNGVEISIEFLDEGPENVETLYDEVVVAPSIVKKIEELRSKGFDGVLINCFDDPGFEAAKEIAKVPVMGAGYASLLAAQILGDTFSIITVGGIESLKATKKRVRMYGFSHKLVSIYSIGMRATDVDVAENEALRRVLELGKKALTEDGADVVVLGCTAFAPLYLRIARELGPDRVVDPTIWGVRILKTLIEHRKSLLRTAGRDHA